MNNLVDFNGCRYLEIGVHQGSTLVAALYGNKPDVAYAIDIKYEELLGSHKEIFEVEYELIIEDCFKVDLSTIKEKINTYHYDGEHTYEDHYKALEYYYPILDDEFIYIVDDWLPNSSINYQDWKHVQDATYAAIKDLGLTIVRDYHMTAQGPGEYHQGCYVALLKSFKHHFYL